MKKLILSAILVVGMYSVAFADSVSVFLPTGEKVHKSINLHVQHFDTKAKADKFAKIVENGDVYKDKDGNGFDVIWGNAKIVDVLVLDSTTSTEE